MSSEPRWGSLDDDSPSVLFVADVLQPIHDFAVRSFLNCNVGHGGGRRGAVPMLFSRREPDHIAGMNFLDRAACPLDPATARRDNKGLPQGVGVPRGTRARLEGNAGAGNPRRIGRLKQRIDANGSGKPVCRTSA